MELVELLDRIDETAPVSCETCLYMATHEACDGCLETDADRAAYIKASNRRAELIRAGRLAEADEIQTSRPFRYANHKPGNWLRLLDARERDGTRNIVIGGQGEAEVNTKWTPEHTSEHLHYVAEQCGYSVGRVTRTADGRKLGIYTSEGHFELHWTHKDELTHIDRIPREGEPVRDWPKVEA